ncbi:MAG: copper amine oxidase N-terminal domain-containing protein [Cellulosilyticum sp.]|nr:copper amine oxidase N-terminal domain-containing protein [Cellulosilyticum sp.]
MNFIKKIALLSTLCIGMVGSFSNLYAAEQTSINSIMMEYGFTSHPTVYSTSAGSIDFVPELRLYQETRNSTVYLIMSVNDTGMHASVNGSSEGIVRDDIYHFAYKVTKTGWYEVKVWGANGVQKTDSLYIKLSDDETTIDLTKEYRNGDCYLVIDVKDDDGIKNVTVNDVSISLSSSGGETSYRVYNTGTYTVTVTDKNDNRKTASLYINVNASIPTLSLSKEYRSGKWYLVIKADASDNISKVTVNNSKITFPTSGGTKEYEVTKSGTYKVVVTDKGGLTRTESLYIDVYEQSKVPPTVKVSQNYKANGVPGWYLIVEAKDDGNIASVTVNGSSINYDNSKGYALYYVPVDGNYTVVVTDNEGNSTTTTTFAAGNAGLNTNNSSSLGSTTIIFKLNNKSWTKNGVAQERMTVAPKAMNSRVYLPIRYIAYALGVDAEDIKWNASARTVTIYDGADIIQLKIGSKVMSVNGRSISMDAAPTSTGGRVMLPISQIKSAFSNRNIQVSWNNTAKQLTIIR